MSDQSIRDHLRNMTDEERNAHDAEVLKTMRAVESAERAVIEAAERSCAAYQRVQFPLESVWDGLFAAVDALRRAREER